MAATFILASNSPRRRVLLLEAGYAFDVVVPAITELLMTQLSLRELTLANASRKALAVARSHRDKVVLAADTLVAMEGEIIGKPRDLEHARIILRRLSGRTHDVCTGVCIVAPQGRICFAEISQVRFRRLSEQAITDYFEVVNPLDKAGAYAAQGAGRRIIAAIEGSVTNVIGLPMERIKETLARRDIRPLSEPRLQFPGAGPEHLRARVSTRDRETIR